MKTRTQTLLLSVHLMVVERWGVLLRLLMLSEKLDKPPTKTALEQHVKRASLQSQGWIRATHLDQKLPNPSDYRWNKDIHGWTSLWTTLPQAAKSCYESIHCGCTRGCVGCCKCVKAGLKCTALCVCSGEFDR